MDLIPKPDQVVVRRQQRRSQADVRRAGRSPPDAPHPDRRRPAARGLPLPPAEEDPRDRRPGAAGHAAGRTRHLLRPAPRLLAGRALRAERAARPTSWSTARSRSRTAGSAWSTGSTRSCPQAIKAVSEHAGGRPVHVIGWSLGGIFALLDRRRPARPADRVADRRRLPVRRQAGAAGRAAAPDPATHRRRQPRHPALPAARRRPEAARTTGLPAQLGHQADHQADRDPAEPRRQPSGWPRSRRSTGSPPT